jgi:hypothetical protein
MMNIKILIVTVIVAASGFCANAQGWVREKSGIYSFGVGGTQVFYLGRYGNGASNPGAAFNVSGEYKVHRFVGIGWQTGVDIFPGGGYYREAGFVYRNSPVIGIPIGFKANVHILEAAGANIRDRLDVYAGLNIGGGPAFYTGANSSVTGFMYGGPQVGVRYWFNKVALFGEFGYGATFANIGISF